MLQMEYPRRLLIFRRPLDVVDDENVHWGFLRFQFQSELLLDRRKN